MTKRSATGASLDNEDRTIVDDGVTSIGQGAKTVTAAGTAEALVSESTPARMVMITTDTANTGRIAIGANDVVAGTDGGSLGAGETVVLPVPNGDLVNMFIDASVSGEGVKFSIFN